MFHNHPRYDGVIVSAVDRIFFGRLIFVFSCVLDTPDTPYSIALIHPFQMMADTSQRDKDLGLVRLKRAPPAASEFVFVKSIVRGALIADDFENPDKAWVIDIIDADMFLRLTGLK
jgi:hypothetical protein